jgi:YjbE family integral membrane protein
MEEFFQSTIWIGFFKIVVLDLILSGDNAVVIGMAARNLPEPQRKKAIWIGSGLAVILRATLTVIAAWLLKIPLLMSGGGLLLLWIAVKLLLEEEENTHVFTGTNMKSAIKTIIIADVVMSLDNVLAVAGAAHGDLSLVVFGFALSIPIIMWGSKLVATLLNKLPWLVYVGSAILGYTAGELMMDDPLILGHLPSVLEEAATMVPAILAVLAVLVGLVLKKTWGGQRPA